MGRCFAHSLPGEPPEKWEPLEDHLRAVADLAGEFAGRFGAADWGRVVGLWHDLGKYSTAFQNYLQSQNGLEAHLEDKPGRVDHSTAGAQHAFKAISPWGRLLAYILAGHHSGLADAASGGSGLQARLVKIVDPFDAAPSELLTQPPTLPNPALSIDASDPGRVAFQLAFFGRMLFSCLVDADFLATELFMSPEKSLDRPASLTPFAEMKRELDRYLADLSSRTNSHAVNRIVYDCRQEVLNACCSAAHHAPGMYSLTVPTGGGKTLASLAFALDHLLEHDLNRVIYAIPFTSIIEQTASVFRDVFAGLPSETVLEHHSNVDPDSKQQTPRSRLAAENWDAPLVVTTNVQLFESLFASRTSSCRKLHNIVGSVIILDEAQTLPVELLRPALAALRELVADYRCTVVLCTATQPALDFRDDFPIGIKAVREIVSEPAELYRRMKRVRIHSVGETADDALVARMLDTPCFLTIVNTRPHAARLFGLLRERSHDRESLFHLSTFLCGQHRSELFSRIRERLTKGLPCRVVSTQLVEAGVDVDFPVVYRAMTGLDSLAQAAGRCNREGKQAVGSVYLFDPVECQPKGYLGSTAATAREVLPDFADLLDPEAIERYFQLHYWKRSGDYQWDERQVMACFPTPPQRFAFDFRSAAERFRMIEDTTKPVFVPYGKGRSLIEQLRREGPTRGVLRRLQRYSVGVYQQVYAEMLGRDVEELPDGSYAVLINEDLYDNQLGLRVDRPGYHEPQGLIV